MKPTKFIVTVRSKTTFGTDTLTLELFEGQDLTQQAETMATGWGASVESIDIDRETDAAWILHTMRVHGLKLARPEMFKGDAKKVTFWLDCLTGAGYLEKRGAEYCKTPKFDAFFIKQTEG